MHAYRWIFVAATLFCAAAPAQAQIDCSKLVPDLEARCEDVNRMNQACGALAGDSRKQCERDTLKRPVKEDCTQVPAAAKSMCEAHNRAAEKAERCNGKVGADLQSCKRENALNPRLTR